METKLVFSVALVLCLALDCYLIRKADDAQIERNIWKFGRRLGTVFLSFFVGMLVCFYSGLISKATGLNGGDVTTAGIAMVIGFAFSIGLLPIVIRKRTPASRSESIRGK